MRAAKVWALLPRLLLGAVLDPRPQPRAHRAPRADVRSILPAMVLARTVLFAAALTAVNGARLMFADSSTGTWGALPRAGTWQSASMTNGRTSNSSHPTVLCPVGSQVAFKWRNSPNLGARRGTGIRDLQKVRFAHPILHPSAQGIKRRILQASL